MESNNILLELAIRARGAYGILIAFMGGNQGQKRYHMEGTRLQVRTGHGLKIHYSISIPKDDSSSFKSPCSFFSVYGRPTAHPLQTCVVGTERPLLLAFPMAGPLRCAQTPNF